MLTQVWSGYSVKEYKNLKGLKKENLRDNMTNMELVLNMLAETSSTENRITELLFMYHSFTPKTKILRANVKLTFALEQNFFPLCPLP